MYQALRELHELGTRRAMWVASKQLGWYLFSGWHVLYEDRGGYVIEAAA